ncbi:Speckle-type POZ protein [Araneus ventricosus]|uniref:Speckle-type POZ protein n=1 Tax=Araneus ventricosus TaxID=182803 RepID=A0A4Y2C3H1_ARAVE|nr:Speckle-type POZ protein [Araneus ventricosus]
MSETFDFSKSFTFFWTVKNMHQFFEREYVYSPCFCVQPYTNNLWCLIIRKENPRGYTEIGLQYLGDQNTTETNGFECEISLLKSDSSAFWTESGRRKIFSQRGFSFLFMKKDDFYNFKHILYPYDTLTIRFRLWCFGTELQASNLCYGVTKLTDDIDSFFWSVRNFSSLETGQTRSRSVKMKLYPSITLNLSLMEGSDDIQIEITKGYSKVEFMTFWRVSIVDIFGKILYQKFILWDLSEKKNSIILQRFIKKSEVVAKKSSYLPYDTLILAFDCECLQKSMNVFDFLGTDNLEENRHKLNSKEPSLNNSCTRSLRVDLINLFKESAISDINLKVGSEIFPAHKAILSARSPVFKAMFTANMKEKKDTCIELEDIESETLHRLLLYIYTDTIEDLQYKTATALYSAADKYHLIALRKKCSEILKTKISISNVGEMLVLADMHSDRDLKSYVESFFLEHRFEIFRSTHWDNFRKNHLSLASEIMHNILLKIM